MTFVNSLLNIMRTLMISQFLALVVGGHTSDHTPGLSPGETDRCNYFTKVRSISFRIVLIVIMSPEHPVCPGLPQHHRGHTGGGAGDDE